MPTLYFSPLHLGELLAHQLAIQTARQEAITAESDARIDAIKARKRAQLVSIHNATETCTKLSTKESKQRTRCMKAESEARIEVLKRDGIENKEHKDECKGNLDVLADEMRVLREKVERLEERVNGVVVAQSREWENEGMEKGSIW